ncbi:hypothetical protein [Shewanella surugensis]|uniref:Helix-turn-helix domain-containing protein n=1 Tax=Shewanella surugensis TaxID=212020 RepID=A0ABT0L970_9GAMM|nr:hypothetical protein [Shewanella surugensis]MCL1124213.1 hypothetical protein [Shewanella surugensis]
MAIYKANVSQEFTVIPNLTTQDKLLSFEARGLLGFMLSLPVNWKFNNEWLQSQSPNCRKDKLSRILKELQLANYLQKQLVRDEKGHIVDTDWLVYPTAITQIITEGRKTRPTGKPNVGKSATIKETSLENKQKKKKKHLNITVPNAENFDSNSKPDKASGKKRNTKPQAFKDLFAVYPAHRKGGTDTSAWNAWKDEKLTDQDAEQAIHWLTQSDPSVWGTNANGQFALGITKFIRGQMWHTPIQLPNQLHNINQCPKSGSQFVPGPDSEFYRG